MEHDKNGRLKLKNNKINKVVKNFVSLIFGNIFGQVLMFVAVVYTARYFGPDNFGIINFANSIILYFTAFANFGLQTYGTIEIAKAKKNSASKINTIISLRLFLAVIAYILIVLVAIFIHKSLVYKLNILFYGLSVFPSAIYIDWIFNANEEMQYNSRSIVIKNLLYSILVIVSLKFLNIKNIYYLAIYMFIATLVSSLYLISVAKKFYNMKLHFIINLKEYKRLIFSAWPFFFSGVFATVNSTIATLMLGFMRSDYEIGIYNSVYKIVNVFLMVAGILFTPVYPVLIKYYNDNANNKLSILVNNLRKIIYIIVVPLIVGSILLNKEIIFTLYGNKYSGASTIFTILMIYVSLLFIREIYGYELSAWNLQKKYMNIVIISSVYNVISNLIFIKYYGIVGASINTLISEAINLLLMFKASRDTVKIRYNNKFIIRIIMSSFIMGTIIFILKYFVKNAIILSIIAIIIYAISLFLTKTISIKEIKENILMK